MLLLDPATRAKLWERLIAIIEEYASQVASGRVTPELDPARLRALLAPLDFRKQWVPIDPLEFAIEHRFGDVAAEIGFLAMELDEIKRSDAGAYALDRYAALTRDGTLTAVSPFFKRYRAVIRAKVEWIRSRQTEGDQSRGHLRRGRGLIELARSYRLSPPGK